MTRAEKALQVPENFLVGHRGTEVCRNLQKEVPTVGLLKPGSIQNSFTPVTPATWRIESVVSVDYVQRPKYVLVGSLLSER